MSERRLKNLVPAVLTIFWALAAKGAGENNPPDPLTLLQISLAPKVAYTCKVVVTAWHSPKGDTALLREWRLPDGRYRIEYLAPKRLRGTVLVSDGKRRWRLVNGQALWDLSFKDLPTKRWDLLRRNYRLSKPRPVTVLNRKAWLVEVQPRAKGKPHHRFWLDAEHGIVLKHELHRSDGMPLAFTIVTDLHFLPHKRIPASLFAVPRKARKSEVRLLSADELQQRWHIRLPNKLPFGFVLEQVEEASVRLRQPVLHATYTDGLLYLSLFALSGDLTFPLPFSRFPMERWRKGGYTFLLIGGVDKPLLKQIAASLRLGDEPENQHRKQQQSADDEG